MEYKVRVKIHELTAKHNISLRQLALRCDIAPYILTKLDHPERKKIQFEHIEKIASELNISDIREIIDLVPVDDQDDPSGK